MKAPRLLFDVCRELHDKYVKLGERMEALVKEGRVLKSSASAETAAARTAVQVGAGKLCFFVPRNHGANHVGIAGRPLGGVGGRR